MKTSSDTRTKQLYQHQATREGLLSIVETIEDFLEVPDNIRERLELHLHPTNRSVRHTFQDEMIVSDLYNAAEACHNLIDLIEKEIKKYRKYIPSHEK